MSDIIDEGREPGLVRSASATDAIALPIKPIRPIPIEPIPIVPIPIPPILAPGPGVTQLPTPVLGGAVGCDFRTALRELLFVEFAGNLSRLDLFPAATIVSSGTTVLNGTWTFDLDNGTEGGVGTGQDIWWEQETATARQMTPQNGASLVNLGSVDFNSLSSAGLQGLTYVTTPIPGNDDATNRLVTGDVFAVRTTAGNYAKVHVASYGYDMTIDWVTYQLDPAYAVLGSGYNEPEDVRASIDGTHAYVTERAGNLLRVDLSNADRTQATVVASGMNSPQQLFLDENAGAAYTVEYAANATMWRIDLTTGATTAVLTGLDHPVGVVLSADGQFAYISEQTSGPDSGRVSQFRITNGQRTALATGMTAPFFLTWADASQTTLYCPQRDPANSLAAINVATQTWSVAAGGLATRPSCVALVNPGLLLVTCDQEIEEIALTPAGQQPNGPLLESIGFVPFDWITPGGLADTTSHDPSFFFPVHDVPFGGSLPVMVNFARAALEGAQYYQVSVDVATNVRTDQFHTAKWDGTQYVPVVVGTQTVNGNPGYYEVPTISDLMLYLDPLPGCYLDSTNLTDATHTITVQLFDAAANPIDVPASVMILVDNRPCAVTLAPAAIGSTTATTACGFLPYAPATSATDQLVIAYTATQPGNFATWGFSLVKASAQVAASNGVVPGPPAPFQESVATALGGCTVAAFAAQVAAYATATTGWGRCSQYDRSALQAFALAP